MLPLKHNVGMESRFSDTLLVGLKRVVLAKNWSTRQAFKSWLCGSCGLCDWTIVLCDTAVAEQCSDIYGSVHISKGPLWEAVTTEPRVK